MASAVRSPRSPGGAQIVAPLGAAAAAVAFGLIITTRTQFVGPQLVLVGLFLLVPAWLAVTRHTGWALGALLVYMGLLDGVLKLKSDNELPTLGRDILLYAVILGVGTRAMMRRERFVLPVFGGWALAWTALVLVQLGNPENGTWAHSFASLRQHIEFVPLLFVGYFILRTHRKVEGFLALLLAVAAVNGAVGVYQSGLSPAQLAGWGSGYAALLNPETSGAPRTAEGANGEQRVRPPGLGSDMGFAGVLGATAIPGGIALLLLRRRSQAQRLLILLGLLGAGAGVLTSQSRSALLTAVVCVFAFVGLLALGGYARRSAGAIVAITVTAIIAVWAVGAVDSSIFYRFESVTPNKVLGTTVDSRRGALSELPDYIIMVPFGAGIGSVGPAAGQFDNRLVRYNAESQFLFLVVEVGLAGLLLFLAFQAALFAAVLRGMRRVRDERTGLLLAGVSAPLFGYAANWIVGVNTVSTPNAAMLWLAAGLIGWWLVEAPRRAADAAEREPAAG